jgi:hypothetical protein
MAAMNLTITREHEEQDTEWRAAGELQTFDRCRLQVVHNPRGEPIDISGETPYRRYQTLMAAGHDVLAM